MTGFATFSAAAKRLEEAREKSMAAAREKFIKLAKDSHAKVQADQSRRAGITPTSTRRVDGDLAKPLEQVNVPGGIVVFEFNYLWEAVVSLHEMLVKNSPYDSGEYRSSHAVLINGREVEIGASPPKLGPKDEIVIVNTVPYSRRLEVGKNNDGSPFVVDVPPRIYETTAKQAKARLGNMARFRSTFIRIAGAYRLKGDQRKRSFAKGFPRYEAKQYLDRTAGQEVTYPAVVVSAPR